MPSQYLNKYCLDINWVHGNIFEWNFDQSNFHWKMLWNCRLQNGSHFVRPQYVNNNNETPNSMLVPDDCVLGWSRWLSAKPYFSLFFFNFPSSNCLAIRASYCYWNHLSILEHIFYSSACMYLAFPKFINNILTWYFSFEIIYKPFVNHHSKYRNRLIRYTHIA